MAMLMQDALQSLDVAVLSKDNRESQGLENSLPAGLKAQCLFDPKAADAKSCWKSADWLVDKVIPGNGDSLDVVTIVGPLAHGKSHSLNSRIFGDISAEAPRVNGHQVFAEQRAADGCGTIGVWVAYQNYDRFLVVDTQGFHEKPLIEVAERDPTSVSAVRNAVKLMAMSDVVIFHTSTPRIDPNETFRFLQEAAVVIEEKLRPALGRTSKPSLIVFHQVLQEHPLDFERLHELLGEVVCNAFSDVQYLPVVRAMERDFRALNAAITQDQTVRDRSTRESVKKSFNILFSPETEWLPITIESKSAIVPVELFACPYKCLACGKSCSRMQHSNSKSHVDLNGLSNQCDNYSETLNNRSFICRKCNSLAVFKGASEGEYSLVRLYKYYTQGANTIDCVKCGTIFDSSQSPWPPEMNDPAVETRTEHDWNLQSGASTSGSITPTVFYSRALLDPLVDATDSLVSILKPKAHSAHKFVLDSVRPDYWVPDDSATQCKLCSTALPEPGDKHHCRQCGNIFCKNCSAHNQPVPERGWGERPVRVCNSCFGNRAALPEAEATPEISVNGRWFLEQVGKLASAATSVGGYLGETIATQTQPDYWQKDSDPDAQVCNCCQQTFERSTSTTPLAESTVMSASTLSNNVGDKRRHHCRMCGKVVCGACSPFRLAVPERGWGERQVRVCYSCYTSRTSLNSK